MNESSRKLTVYFDDPFWVGVSERIENGKLSVCKVTFGAEPKDYKVWAFVLKHYRLKPYSIAYEQTGMLTVGYLAYAVIGMVFSTPAPFLSVLILALCRERIGLKAFFQRMLHTEKKLEATLLTAGFCLAALLFALLCGTPTGSPWYMLPLGFLVMIPVFAVP